MKKFNSSLATALLLVVLVACLILHFLHPSPYEPYNSFHACIFGSRLESSPDTVTMGVTAAIDYYQRLGKDYSLELFVHCMDNDWESREVHYASLTMWVANNFQYAIVEERNDDNFGHSITLSLDCKPSDIKTNCFSVTSAKIQLEQVMIKYMRKQFPQQNFSDKVYEAWSEKEE